jgi:hypothetical protein
MVSSWTTVPGKSLFRRTAVERKHRIEQLQAAASIEPVSQAARMELMQLGVAVNVQLRVSPKRWRGWWRVEQLI